MRIHVIITWTSIWPGDAVRAKVQREAGTVGETRGRGPEREIEEDVSPGMHFNSLICPIFLCSFCLDDCGTLHIFTLEVHGEWGVGVEGGGCVHTCVVFPLSTRVCYSTQWDGQRKARTAISRKGPFPRAKMEPGDVNCETIQHLLPNRAVRSSPPACLLTELRNSQRWLNWLSFYATPSMCVLLARAVREDLFWFVLMAAGATLGLSRHPARAPLFQMLPWWNLMGAIPATRQWFESWRRLLRKSDW